jgi:shikimate kinase
VGINQSRPLLLGNVRATLAQLLDERAPLYSQVASLTIATDERTPGDIATQIVDWLQS